MMSNTTAICLATGLLAFATAMLVQWLMNRGAGHRREAVLAGCLADAGLLFPLSDHEVSDLRTLATNQEWAGTRDLFRALSGESEGEMAPTLRRKVGMDSHSGPLELRSTAQIERNTRASVHIIEKDSTGWRTIKLTGRIAGVRDTGLFFEPDTAIHEIPAGSPVSVRFRRMDDAQYEFKSFLAEAAGVLLKIEHPDGMRRVQERSHARIPVGRLVDFSHLSEDEVAGHMTDAPELAVRPHTARGLLVDLSAGGAAIRTQADLKVNDLVVLDMSRLANDKAPTLPGTGVVGRVIDSTIQTSAKRPVGRPWRRSRIKFIRINERERRCIVRYVDHKLLESRRLSA